MGRSRARTLVPRIHSDPHGAADGCHLRELAAPAGFGSNVAGHRGRHYSPLGRWKAPLIPRRKDRLMQTRIGFVGTGVIANRHLGVLLGFEDVRVVAAADPQEDRVRSFSDRCGATAYTDPKEMLAHESLDALYICVPPFAHGAPEATALAQGIPFFVEKPLAVDLETAEEIAHQVEERALTTAAGYHWRYLNIV